MGTAYLRYVTCLLIVAHTRDAEKSLIEAEAPDARTACLRALLALPVAPKVWECC